jgi:hypothetical protein
MSPPRATLRAITEIRLRRGLAVDLGQPRHAVALQAAMKGRARQMWKRWLERIKAVAERQEGMPSESDRNRLFFYGQDG